MMPKTLREPKGQFQTVIRKLAEIAMSVTHHDASEDEAGYIHEVHVMEKRFTAILRGKLFPALNPADATPAGEAVQMAVPADVAALVVASREAWETLQDEHPTYEVTGSLSKALEAFASRVCWDDDGGSIPEAHANPHTCGLESGER